MSELALPAHLREATAPAERRQTRVYSVVGPAKAQVLVSAVNVGRQGWKHEVQAEWNTHDADGPVIKRDLLWFTDYDTAMRMAEAAHRFLARGTPAAGFTLSALARHQHIAVR